MGLKYVWDTNTVIYYLQNSFPAAGEIFIDEAVNNYPPVISIVTEIELLCWRHATQADIANIKEFVANAVVYDLDQNIKSQTISIRKQTNLKLPDAIIAATAVVNNLTLISRNTIDFRKIEDIDLIDPFNL